VYLIQLVHSCRGPEKKCFIYFFSKSTRQWYFYYNNMKIRNTCMCAYLHTRKREVCYSNRVMYGEDFSQGFEQIKKKERKIHIKIYIYIWEYSKPYYYRVLGSTASGCSEDARACVHYTFYIWLEWLCTLFAYVIRFFQMERDIYVSVRMYTYILCYIYIW